MVKQGNPCKPSSVPQGSKRLRLTIFKTIDTGRLYLPGNIPDTHFCQRLSRAQSYSAGGRIASIKNSSDTMRNRTRYLRASTLRATVWMSSSMAWATVVTWERLYVCKTVKFHVQNQILPEHWIFISGETVKWSTKCKRNNSITVERRLSERQSSETSNIRTHIFFVLRSNNEKSAITSRNKILCHFY